MSRDYPHYGPCFNCGLSKDLNERLYCETCEERRAKLDTLKFWRIIPMPTDANPFIDNSFIDELNRRDEESGLKPRRLFLGKWLDE